jgi:hypothetical protein
VKSLPLRVLKCERKYNQRKKTVELNARDITDTIFFPRPYKLREITVFIKYTARIHVSPVHQIDDLHNPNKKEIIQIKKLNVTKIISLRFPVLFKPCKFYC